jgi:(p)ppGpp synthase/HD superfamily hydrolase
MQLSDRFTNALQFACRLHADQQRKVSGTPYVAHLLRVAGIVLEAGGSEDEAIAALLHDAIEDQGGAGLRSTLEGQFGTSVVKIVDACTDADTTPKPPWRERKEAFLARIPAMSGSARRVVAADKLDNVRSLLDGYAEQGEALWEFFRGGREGTLWYYRSVADALAKASPCPLAESLSRTVGQLESLVSP